jgi:hypothetical protein
LLKLKPKKNLGNAPLSRKFFLVGLFCSVFLLSFESQAQSLLSREGWNAEPAIKTRMKRHKIREITVHHIGFSQDPSKSLEQKLQRLQKHAQRNKPWGDIPYHFFIDLDGKIAEGRDLKYAGDTNTGYNPANRVHIVLEGNFDVEQPSSKQRSSLQSLVTTMRRKYGLANSKIYGHGDHAPTACPGKNLYQLIGVLASGGSI